MGEEWLRVLRGFCERMRFFFVLMLLNICQVMMKRSLRRGGWFFDFMRIVVRVKARGRRVR